MTSNRAFVVQCDMITPYGRGVDACFDGLMAGRSAIGAVERFDAGEFHSSIAGTVSGLSYMEGESLVVQMLRAIINPSTIPSDADMLLATAKGEIDLLERHVLEGGADIEVGGDAPPWGLQSLLGKARALTGAAGRGLVVSAACVSSTAALARAASMVRSGESDCVAVIACDAVTEFVYSGFSSLMALDEAPARPFDSNRAGLSIGEAAAYALVMSGARARREGRKAIGEIAGWGLSSDANHMTGPSRDGAGLASAIEKALKKAALNAAEIGSVSAHGTGTMYNDSMEMKALKKVFGEAKRPVYSVKGGFGHTMGAAGLVETLLGFRALASRAVPPTVNLMEVDAEAEGWVHTEGAALNDDSAMIAMNSGFGGVNVALVLQCAGGNA